MGLTFNDVIQGLKKEEPPEKFFFAAFPLLYRDKGASIHESLIPFGLEVGDGWLSMIWELSEKLEVLIQGWTGNDINEEVVEDHPAASQVKSKFGGLRFYMTHATDEMYKLIDEYEAKSYSICEACGSDKATQVGKGWIFTLCPSCWERMKQ